MTVTVDDSKLAGYTTSNGSDTTSDSDRSAQNEKMVYNADLFLNVSNAWLAYFRGVILTVCSLGLPDTIQYKGRKRKGRPRLW